MDQIERLQSGSEEEHVRQMEFLTYRIEEIERANLNLEEETELERDHDQASHAQEMMELSGAAAQALTEGEGAAFEGLTAARTALQRLKSLLPDAAAWNDELEQAITSVQEIVRSLEGACDGWDASPDRMQWLDERLTTYRMLKRKYGSSVEEVLENLQAWRGQLNELESRDKRLEELMVKKAEKLQEVVASGEALRARREMVADQLSECITKSLAELGFEHGFFDITLEVKDPAPNGMDTH